MMRKSVVQRVSIILSVVALTGGVAWQSLEAQQTPQRDAKAQFLALCNLAVREMDKKIAPFKEIYRTTENPATHHFPFFEDSYGVRALLVAYDMTGNKKYLDASTRWSDQVIKLQQGMIPKGAYYMNYADSRAPGEVKGDWNVADSGSIAMAVLATAVRTHDLQEKQRYLRSIRSFARLVIDNYVGKDGGITDGLWPDYAGEWWSSTATFGAFLYLAYGQTRDPEYLKVALRATDWLNRHSFDKPQPPAFEALSPGVVFYCLESYATAMPYLEPHTQRRREAEAHINEALDWLAKNQRGRGAKTSVNYMKATYMAGMPYVMYELAREVPQYRNQRAAADRELSYLHGLLWKDGKPRVTRLHIWELTTWTMMSYAAKLDPGTLFRSSRKAPRQ